MAGRMKKTGKNIAFSFANQIVTIILAFIARTVFVHRLGVDFLGLSGVFNSVLRVISMADLGLQTAMIYSFYKPLAEEDHDKLAALTQYYRKIYLVIASAAALLGLALIPFLPRIINLDNEIPHLTGYYLLSLSGVVVTYLCVYRTSILTADQKDYLVSRTAIWVNFGKTALQILSILIFGSYFAFLLIGVVGGILQNIITSRLASREYPYILNKADLSGPERKEIFKNIRPVLLYKLSAVVQDATDNLLTSVMIGTAMVGYYSNYAMIELQIVGFVRLLFGSMTASVGNLLVEEKAERRYEVFLSAQSVGLIISAVVIPCYIVLVSDFIELWFGSEFTLPFAAVAAIGINMYLSCVQRPLWAFSDAAGLYRKTKYAKLICAALNLALSIALGRLIGLAGILFATAISAAVTYVWYELKLIFEEYFDMKPAGYYIELALNFCLVIGLTAFCGWLTGMIGGAGIIWWLIKAAVSGTVCLTVSMLVYAKTRGFALLMEKASRLIRGED